MSGSIRAEQLGKRYKQFARPWRRALEWATAGRFRGHQELWALRDVTFSVEPGEAVGIVGQNGAGKSTLLKLIVGTTLPTTGRFEVSGQVAALLELGMGFHPEFNGRQNAMMALQMMGYGEPEARVILPDVESFSELGAFMEQPLRTYSSGMQMRLGFAVATARRPAILIVDEALSVGDAYFQHKCIRRIREFKAEGTTMLFVSHDPAAVKTLCDRALLLDEGLLIREGRAEAVLDYYNALIAQREKRAAIAQRPLTGARVQTRSGDGKARILAVTMCDGEGRESMSFSSGEPASVRCRFQAVEALAEYTVGILIRDRLGNEVFGTNTLYLDVPVPAARAGEEKEAIFDLELGLGYGHYSVTVAVHSPSGHIDRSHDWIDNALSFQVLPGDSRRFAGVASLAASARLESR